MNSVEIDLSSKEMKKDGVTFPIREVKVKCIVLKHYNILARWFWTCDGEIPAPYDYLSSQTLEDHYSSHENLFEIEIMGNNYAINLNSIFLILDI